MANTRIVAGVGAVVVLAAIAVIFLWPANQGIVGAWALDADATVDGAPRARRADIRRWSFHPDVEGFVLEFAEDGTFRLKGAKGHIVVSTGTWQERADGYLLTRRERVQKVLGDPVFELTNPITAELDDDRLVLWMVDSKGLKVGIRLRR